MFPAYAGMNRRLCHGLSLVVRVPRIRGDEPFFCRYFSVAALCSPHTRG